MAVHIGIRELQLRSVRKPQKFNKCHTTRASLLNIRILPLHDVAMSALSRADDMAICGQNRRREAAGTAAEGGGITARRKRAAESIIR